MKRRFVMYQYLQLRKVELNLVKIHPETFTYIALDANF